MGRRRVGVSKIAEYAADPVDYIKRKGKPRSAAAARYGTKAHNSLGKNNANLGYLIKLIALLLIGAITIWYLGGSR